MVFVSRLTSLVPSRRALFEGIFKIPSNVKMMVNAYRLAVDTLHQGSTDTRSYHTSNSCSIRGEWSPTTVEVQCLVTLQLVSQCHPPQQY